MSDTRRIEYATEAEEWLGVLRDPTSLAVTVGKHSQYLDNGWVAGHTQGWLAVCMMYPDLQCFADSAESALQGLREKIADEAYLLVRAWVDHE